VPEINVKENAILIRLEMKVILEIEYNSSEFTIITLFKFFREFGICPRVFKISDKPRLTDQGNNKEENYYSVTYIKKVVCLMTGITEDLFESHFRKQEVAENRQIAMYLSRRYTRKSLREIGQEFGNKTPATIMHACKAIQNLIQTDKKFKEKFDQIEKKLISG
jgi:hypothetical protein